MPCGYVAKYEVSWLADVFAKVLSESWCHLILCPWDVLLRTLPIVRKETPYLGKLHVLRMLPGIILSEPFRIGLSNIRWSLKLSRVCGEAWDIWSGSVKRSQGYETRMKQYELISFRTFLGCEHFLPMPRSLVSYGCIRKIQGSSHRSKHHWALLVEWAVYGWESPWALRTAFWGILLSQVEMDGKQCNLFRCSC